MHCAIGLPGAVLNNTALIRQLGVAVGALRSQALRAAGLPVVIAPDAGP